MEQTGNKDQSEEIESELLLDMSSDDLEQLGSFYHCATCGERPIGFSPTEVAWQCLDCIYDFPYRADIEAAIAARAEQKLKVQQSIVDGVRRCKTCSIDVAVFTDGKLTWTRHMGGTKSRRGEPLEYFCRDHWDD